MPVSSRGPRRRRSWWCHTCSSTPSARTPAKRAGSSDAACRHGLMWDHTVFHVVASCRARPAIVAPSKRSCRIAQQIARAPRRAPGCAHPLVMFQECHRLAGGFSAYPSPYCATGSLPESRPRARRSPLPPHAHDLERSPHNQGSPPAGCTTQHRAPEPQGCEPHSSDGSPPSRRADHTDHNDQATRSSRQGETPPELLDDSGGRSPLIIKDLDLYPQPPTNTHSPILNSEEPDFCRVDKRRQYEHTYKHAYEEHLRLRSGCGTI